MTISTAEGTPFLSTAISEQQENAEGAIYEQMMEKIDAIINSPLNLIEEEYIKNLHTIQELKLAPRGQAEMVIRLRRNETVRQQYSTKERSKEGIPEKLLRIKSGQITDFNHTVFDVFITMLSKEERESLPNLVKLGTSRHK